MSNKEFYNEDWKEELTILTDVLDELVGLDTPLHGELNLVDELALDSLDMLEMFFKIQARLERQLNHEQIEKLLNLEMIADKDIHNQGGQLVMYSKLKVCHVLGYMRRQTRSLVSSEQVQALLQDLSDSLEAIPEQISYQDALSELKEKNPKLSRDFGTQQVIPQDQWIKAFQKTDLQTSALENALQYFASSDSSDRIDQIKEFLKEEKTTEIISDKIKELVILDLQDSNEEKLSWTKSASNSFLELIGAEQLSRIFPNWQNVSHENREKIQGLIETFIEEKVQNVLHDNQEKKIILDSFLQDEFDPTEDQLFQLGQEQESKNKIVRYYVRSNLDQLIQEFQLNYSDRLFDLVCNESDLEPWSALQEEFMSIYKEQKKLAGVQAHE